MGRKQSPPRRKPRRSRKSWVCSRMQARRWPVSTEDVTVDGQRKQVCHATKFDSPDMLTCEIGTRIDQLLFKGMVQRSRSTRQLPLGGHDGTSGHIILDGVSDVLTTPQISFVPLSGDKATFIFPIDDIVEIKKVSRVVCLCPSRS